MIKMEFIVNGKKCDVEVEGCDTLAYVLREQLGLIGTKIACDRGQCGACTVLMDGKPILSCTTLAAECQGKVVTTIEGLANGGKLHPIQQAFIDHHGFQCGFCTPGMILSAKALLDKDPNPTENEVREAISGNICRCTGYIKPVKAIMAAARAMSNM